MRLDPDTFLTGVYVMVDSLCKTLPAAARWPPDRADPERRGDAGAVRPVGALHE
jgi:hypothetical protein